MNLQIGVEKKIGKQLNINDKLNQIQDSLNYKKNSEII